MTTSDALTFDVATTVDDYYALLLLVGRSPRSLALQAILVAGLALWFVVFVLAVGVLTALFEPASTMSSLLIRYATTGWRADLAPLWPWIAGGAIALFLANLFLFYPRQAKALAVRLVDSYPEGREGSPTRQVITRVDMTPEKIICETRDQRVSIHWSMIRRLVATRRHIFLTTSRSTAVVIPKRALDETRLAEVIAFVSDRLASERPAT